MGIREAWLRASALSLRTPRAMWTLGDRHGKLLTHFTDYTSNSKTAKEKREGKLRIHF